VEANAAATDTRTGSSRSSQLKQQHSFGLAWLARVKCMASEEIGKGARCEADRRGLRGKVNVLLHKKGDLGGGLRHKVGILLPISFEIRVCG
jgi:hypothetical protein